MGTVSVEECVDIVLGSVVTFAVSTMRGATAEELARLIESIDHVVTPVAERAYMMGYERGVEDAGLEAMMGGGRDA